jgi:hypothetical protein
MFKFDHTTQELNLIIASLEHKIRDMQEMVAKLVAHAQTQLPKPEKINADNSNQS